MPNQDFSSFFKSCLFHSFIRYCNHDMFEFLSICSKIKLCLNKKIFIIWDVNLEKRILTWIKMMDGQSTYLRLNITDAVRYKFLMECYRYSYFHCQGSIRRKSNPTESMWKYFRLQEYQDEWILIECILFEWTSWE